MLEVRRGGKELPPKPFIFASVIGLFQTMGREGDSVVKSVLPYLSLV